MTGMFGFGNVLKLGCCVGNTTVGCGVVGQGLRSLWCPGGGTWQLRVPAGHHLPLPPPRAAARETYMLEHFMFF